MNKFLTMLIAVAIIGIVLYLASSCARRDIPENELWKLPCTVKGVCK